MQLEKALPAARDAVSPWQQLLIDENLLDEAQASFPDLNTPVIDKNARHAAICDALALLTEPDQVVEMRILGVGGKRHTDSGYFDDLDKLAHAAAGYEGRAEGIYFTVNPVNPALLSRASNRVKEYAENTTSDADIVRRITLPIDFDPIRPAGISSNDEEHRLALERAWACRTWLKAQGWPDPVFADSGNGAHLPYAIDLPNDADSTDLLKRCLTALSYLFSDERVKVDIGTGNASRIFKLYGTLARKGDSTPERPHRRAAIITAPATRQPVSRELLEALAALAPVAQKPAAAPMRLTTTKYDSNHGNHSYANTALEREVAAVAAAQPGNRNNQLFKSSAALFSLIASHALEESRVWDALVTAAHAVGLSETEARRTIQSGAERGFSQPRIVPTRNAPPNAGPNESKRPVQRPELEFRQAKPAPSAINPQPKPSADLMMHVDDLDELPPIRWLIKDFLPEDSLVEVYGAPSAGKTQVVFDMAQTLAASGKTVIYVVAEGLRGYRSRKKAWQQFRKQPGGELYIWREPVQLFELAAVKQFIAAIQSRKPALVVFDTLSRCSLGADENNQKDMGFILDSLDRVRRETGATVLAVHHSNANGGRERGSTVIRGGMTVMMEVTKEDDLIAVACAKVKDSSEFDTLYLKPVLVDIGEEAPVPVLVPAEKRVQTRADKLSSLQLEILRAVGMEMFATSGIKSSQLDEILPPLTKRASKYYSLNILIRLGYIEPHEKGDPYKITEAGRLKLSNAEEAVLSVKSNMSKSSLSPFIWTLPESCPMSSPASHTYRCEADETLDNTTTTSTDLNKLERKPAATSVPSTPTEIPIHVETSPVGHALDIQPAVLNTSEVLPVLDEDLDDADAPALTEAEIQAYARQIGVDYPTTDGAALYKIAEIVPQHLRDAFEIALGDAVTNYLDEVIRRNQQPSELPVPDVLALYLPLGFVSTDALYAGYKRACALGHKMPFLNALRLHNTKAIEHLKALVAGKRYHDHMVISALPRFG